MAAAVMLAPHTPWILRSGLDSAENHRSTPLFLIRGVLDAHAAADRALTGDLRHGILR
jgi:hypothetical protein